MHAITASYRQGSRESKRKLFSSQSHQGRPSPRFVPSTFSLLSSSLTYRQTAALLPTFHISITFERGVGHHKMLDKSSKTHVRWRASTHMAAARDEGDSHVWQNTTQLERTAQSSWICAGRCQMLCHRLAERTRPAQTTDISTRHLSATTSVSPSMPPTDRRVTFMESRARVPSHATWLWVLSLKVLNHATHFS